MNFDDIKEDLVNFEVYKKKLLFINEIKDYSLFYLIVYNGKILRFNNKKINVKKLKDEFINSSKYIDLSHYVKNELYSEYIEKNLYKKSFQVITYLIPKDKRTKNDFNKMNDLVFEFDKSCFEIINKPISKLFEHINKHYMAYIGIYTLYLLVYTAYLYLGLYSVGIPFDLIKSIESFIAMIFIVFSGFILILTLVVPIIVSIIYLDNNTLNIIIVIFLIVIVSYYLITKTYKFVFFYTFLKFLVLFLCNILCRIIPIVTLLILLSLPFVYVLELIFSKNKAYTSQPTLLINLYKDFYGYPNVIEVKDKKYILVGKDETTYQVYNLNKTVNYYYISNKDSKATKKLCINIEDIIQNKDKKDDIALKLLMFSPNNNIDNDLKYLKINDTNITKKYEYSAKNIDLNTTLLINNCQGIN